MSVLLLMFNVTEYSTRSLMSCDGRVFFSYDDIYLYLQSFSGQVHLLVVLVKSDHAKFTWYLELDLLIIILFQ